MFLSLCHVSMINLLISLNFSTLLYCNLPTFFSNSLQSFFRFLTFEVYCFIISLTFSWYSLSISYTVNSLVTFILVILSFICSISFIFTSISFFYALIVLFNLLVSIFCLSTSSFLVLILPPIFAMLFSRELIL